MDLKNGIQDTELSTINTKDLYQDGQITGLNTRLTTVETKLNL